MARILVVDDNVAVRTSLGTMLERDGFEVELVDNGRAGLRSMAVEDFDALIVDIFMPEMDGFEFIRTVREQKPALPIIAISGSTFGCDTTSKPDFLSMATRLGATHSLRKPFTPADLRAAIQLCLAGAAENQGEPAESKP